MNRSLFSSLCLAFVVTFGSTLSGQEPERVESKIETGEAWMGQGVRMSVTLFSPGPFSGTAVFQLPEIPGTLIVKHGSPQVGSETVDGESMLTQRHEFSIYTQQEGAVEIPAFPVSYESKNDFLGDPVPRSGMTEPVSFLSKRPPGTEALGIVVSSATTKVSQTWSVEEAAKLEAGEIVTRTIVREASDVSAMFFPPFKPTKTEGARIYPGEPEVIDKRERGVHGAKRTDTIKYQFERGGNFAIPEISYAWWNPEKEEIEAVKLEGLTLSVAAPPTPREAPDEKAILWSVLVGILLGLALNYFVIPFLERRYQAWKERRNAPEAVESRALIRACRENRPNEAYIALMKWQRAGGIGRAWSEKLQVPAEELSRFLFSRESPGHRWDGTPLLVAFREELHLCKRGSDRETRKEVLPPLNPRAA